MNYASLGFALGHELTHGFDDQGNFGIMVFKMAS